MKKYLTVAGMAVLALIAMTIFVARTALAELVIPSDGMSPTLTAGTRVFVDKLYYRNHEVQVDDIVLFMPPIRSVAPFLQRVVAAPGDRVAVRHGRLYRNGIREVRMLPRASYDLRIRKYAIYVDDRSLDMNIATIPPRSQWPSSATVPNGCYVVLGDNRRNSEDSHVFGFVCPGQIGAAGYQARILGKMK